ncbi:S-layer homology domain-containing protein [Butyricicoccus sp. AM78-15b2TA]|uniref:S-layer homology domain-containing protein n=1 Tax=Butyricicoccus sp. AM78-15b2TA TaxID=3002516 RepID=UPI0022E75504|nr:S-layer homology domain-containing protein [Butyricicoccus sp. AM78-15b2TA]
MLAFACAFTMFAGAASYSDKADIKATTAVDMLSSLGVIQGYDDGSFKPNTTVTRAQMAKMIFTIMNGGNDNANAYASLPTKFTDLPTAAWAQGYVRYLQNTGIIAGKSVTKFAPNDTVTGLEAAKMVLVAAGYNAQKAGLTGAAWAQNTMKYGQLNNLFEDVDADLNAALPRQYAAQILYNALDMKRVVWSNDINDFKNATDVSGEKTIGEKYMDLYKTSAEVLTSVKKTSGKDTYEIKLADKVKYADDKKEQEFTKVPTDVSDLLGLKVKVLVRVKTNGDQDVYGVYADDDSKVIATGTVGQLESVGAASDKKTKLAGTEYKMDDTRNGLKVIYANQGQSTDKLSKIEGQKDISEVAGTVKLVDTNGNNKVDTVVVTPAVVGQVTYAGSKSVTISNKVGSKDIDDLDIYEGYAKDDWTVVTSDTYTASGDTAVAKIDVTTAKVTSTKKNNSTVTEVKVNDEWYKIADNAEVDTLKAGNTYDFAIVGNYVVNADETEADSSDVLVVTDFEDAKNGMQSSTTQKVKAYFLDGSSKTITVEKLDLTAGDGKDEEDVSAVNSIDANDVNKLYSYSTRSNGNYTLKALGKDNKAGYESISNTSTTGVNSKNRVDGKLISDNAVVLNVYNEIKDAHNKGTGVYKDVKVLSGKTVNDWDIKTNTTKGTSVAYATKKSSGVESIRVLVLTSDKKLEASGSDYKYAYMTSDTQESTEGEDNDKTLVYEAWTGSENVTLKYDGTDAKKLGEGDLLIYTNDGDKFINVENNDADVTVYKVAITGNEGKNLIVQGSKVFSNADKNYTISNTLAAKTVYTVDDDVVYIAVNDDKHEAMNGTVQNAEETAKNSGVYYANAYIVVENDDDQHVVAVVFDADNNHLDGDVKVKADGTLH